MRVTIGLPFHDAAGTLAPAIRSVFAQTFTDWELLLVDDGSVDESRQIARAVVDPRVRLIEGDANVGLAGRLNQIADLARGEYLARLDADDLMHPDRLARHVEVLDANPEVDLVASSAYSIDREEQIRGLAATAPFDPQPSAMLLNRGMLVHGSMTGRTAWFRRNGYDASMRRSEDFDLWCRVAGTVTIAKLPEPLYFLRELGVFHLGRYLEGKRLDRGILARYGPSLVGWPRTAAMIAAATLKGEIFRLADAIGKADLLVSRRSVALGEVERAEGERVLARIRTVRIPGLEPEGRARAMEGGGRSLAQERVLSTGAPPHPAAGEAP